MPCNLRKDPSLAFDFLATSGSSATIFIDSDAGSATLQSADLNGADLPVGADGKITTPALQTGLAVLTITIDAALIGDEVRVKQDCGGGNTQLLKTFTFNGDPQKSYQIDVS